LLRAVLEGAPNMARSGRFRPEDRGGVNKVG